MDKVVEATQQNPQNIIRQTALKHYNQYISIITETLIWLQITIDTGKNSKLKLNPNKNTSNY